MAWYETKKGGTARITEKTATGEIATFTTVIGGLPLKSCAVSIQGYQEGTGDPTPVNKRPIITFTGASVVRTGKNLWDEEWELGDISADTGLPTTSNNLIRTKNFIPIKPDTQYYAYVTGTGSNTFRTRFYDANYNYIGSTQKNGNPVGYNSVFTSPINAYYMKFTPQISYGTTYGNDISINYPSTDTDYHAFVGSDTYSIAWKTEAGEVYSGTINFATGELTATWVDFYFDGSVSVANVGYSSSVQKYYATVVNPLTYTGINSVASNAHIISDKFLGKTGVEEGHCYLSASGTIIVAILPDQTITTKEQATTWFQNNPTHFVYELETPLTVQLTPTEIKTVLGENYVWGDCGGNTSIVCYDGNVEHLDDLRDTYDSVNRPDVPTLIAGSTAFDYSALMSKSATIPQNMFNGCTVVQDVESPYVTTVGANAFAGATNLKYISLPNCTQVGAAAFSCQRTGTSSAGAWKNVKIDLPKCTQMGTRAFYKFGASDATAELEFPELTQIGSDCFSADGSTTAFTIKSIKLPKLVEAGSTAFQRMTAETIDIGSSCTQLNTTPLAYANVTNFICRATTPPALGSSAGLGGTNMTLGAIYVPDAALSDYTDNTNYPRWAKHAALMHPLSDIEPTT